MKNFMKMAIIFAIIPMLFNFCSTQKAETTQEKKESGITITEKKAPERPQYEITVIQNQKELGKIVLETFPDIAPKHAANFDKLVSENFYDGTAFHRVIPGFMIQGGDPNSKNKPKNTWGFGDPSQPTVPAEFNDISHERGILSAARSNDPNSATSQFFICHAAAKFLDGKYTAYGKVLKGIEVVDKVCEAPRNGEAPVDKIEMKIRKIK